MKAFKTLGQALAVSALAVGTATGSVEARGHSTLNGQISLKGQPVRGSSITVWQTQAGQSPKQLSTHRSTKTVRSTSRFEQRRGSCTTSWPREATSADPAPTNSPCSRCSAGMSISRWPSTSSPPLVRFGPMLSCLKAQLWKGAQAP